MVHFECGGIVWYINCISIKLLKKKKAMQLLPRSLQTLALGALDPPFRKFDFSEATGMCQRTSYMERPHAVFAQPSVWVITAQGLNTWVKKPSDDSSPPVFKSLLAIQVFPTKSQAKLSMSYPVPISDYRICEHNKMVVILHHSVLGWFVKH